MAKVTKAVNAGGKDVSTEVAKAVVSDAIVAGIRSSPLTTEVLQSLPEKYQKKLLYIYRNKGKDILPDSIAAWCVFCVST